MKEEIREDRQKLWDEYQGDKPNHLRHPWLDYSRYRYADQIMGTLASKGVDFTKLVVIDYGAGVGDYGFEFGRQGSELIFYDTMTYLNFLKFRAERDPIKFTYTLIDCYAEKVLPMERINVGLFGEVLEHLDNPLQVLTEFVTHNVKYLYTSSYPYRSEDPNDHYWNHPGHHHDTRTQQAACRQLLEDKYHRIRYNGEASLWERKNA